MLDPNISVKWEDITEEERRFANIVILHIQASFINIQSNTTIETDGFDYDIRTTISLPIFNAVWEHNKICYYAKFVKFVEEILNNYYVRQ